MSSNGKSTGEDALQAMRWNLDAMSLRPTDLHPPQDIRRMIRDTDSLPSMPKSARQLLELMDSPDADAIRLAAIMERDPLLTTQCLRWANSAYYGLRRPVESVRDAVTRVLGFEQAAGLALGLTSMAPLETPSNGPIGRDRVWSHALLCAQVMLTLRQLLPESRRPRTAFCQLLGLVQNIGYLLLGHLLPSQFTFLSRLLDKNPEISLPVIEGFVLGVDHTQLGQWLLEAWGMPLPLQVAVRQHHNHAYRGSQQDLVLLGCLADQCLSRSPKALGPAVERQHTEDLLSTLGIREEDYREATRTLLGTR